MKKIRQIIGFLVIGISSLSAAELPCEQHYAAGMEKMSQGRDLEAAAEFEAAIRLSPNPRAGDSEYLPYIHLAVASFKAGRFQSARNALVQSQVYGVAAKTATGMELINQFATPIMLASLDVVEGPLPEVSVASFRDFEQAGVALSPDRIEEIRMEVLKRCALSDRLDKNKLPWYFHYEFGIELMAAGDPQSSLDALVVSANLLEESHRRKRMYGMRHIDYLPYYRIALAHARLGNWESARDAIRISGNFGEFTQADPDYEAFAMLENLIASNLGENES